MSKRGIALAVVLGVVAVLSVIIVSLFSMAIHENNLVRRYVNTVRAFWLAEAGVSKSFITLDNVYGTIKGEQGCPSEAACFYEAKVEELDPVFILDPGDGGWTVKYFFAEGSSSPAFGYLSLNDAPDKSTVIYVSKEDKDNESITHLLSEVDSGDYITVSRTDGEPGRANYRVTSVTQEANHFEYGISKLAAEGLFNNDCELTFVFGPQETTEIIYKQYYQIDSTGTVVLADGSQFQRQITVFVSAEAPHHSNFSYAIETTGELVIKGQAYTIEPEGSTNPNAALNFSDLFGATKEKVKASADNLYSEEDNFAGGGVEVSGLTWVEVSSGKELTISGNFEGEGILIVEGDCHITGTESFKGIIYVIGELTVSGNASITGSVLAESAAGIDTTLAGNINITYDEDVIKAALGSVSNLSKEVVAWKQK